ncbi:MAG TPA: hypothetical protein DCZ94_01920 [Lentisphaeria bacterium]|nr:MAG: hypothetical protein A2X48_22640 [Lentisphaerae bacterium GWF2_49_21]HBC85690.1 hypothetical protein [Lentisphaeria bacterium]
MKIGTCADPNAGQILKDAGFDFIEMGVGGALKPDKPYAEFVTELDRIQKSPLPCLVVNCLMPGHMKITGPEVSLQSIKLHLSTVCERAEAAGIKKIVFGSGGSRKCPEGFDRKKAFDQLVEFGKILGDEAEKHNVIIAVEPLNKNECNMLNSIKRTMDYVNKVGIPSFRLHADSFHWGMEDEADKDFRGASSLITHAHIATYKSRLSPGFEEADFTRFFSLLKQCGYDDTIAIEGKWAAYDCGFGININDPKVAADPSHLRKAVEIIKKYL